LTNRVRRLTFRKRTKGVTPYSILKGTKRKAKKNHDYPFPNNIRRRRSFQRGASSKGGGKEIVLQKEKRIKGAQKKNQSLFHGKVRTEAHKGTLNKDRKFKRDPSKEEKEGKLALKRGRGAVLLILRELTGNRKTESVLSTGGKGEE